MIGPIFAEPVITIVRIKRTERKMLNTNGLNHFRLFPAWLRRALALIVLSYVFGVVVLSIRYAHRNFYRVSDSMEPVNIQIGDHHYAIPKAYIWDSTALKGGVLNGVNMHAILPDMLPYRKDYAEEFKKPGSPHKILILLERRPDIFSNKRTLRLYQEKYIDDPPSVGPDNLMKYQFARTFSRDELFVNEENKENPVVIMCKREKLVPYPNCTSVIEYKKDLIINIAFSKSKLSEWREIQKNVTDLILKFE